MAQRGTAFLRLTNFGGGLNDTDPVHRIGDNQLSAASEVVLTPSGGIARRGGNTQAFAPPSTSANFDLLVRHTPSQLLSATEVWALPRAGTTFYRSTTGTTWTSVTVPQVENANGAVSDAVSFNGKLYLAYAKNAGTDRLHVWDGTSVRVSGIETPAAPTVADTGSGSLAATIRYYKVQFHTGTSAYVFSDLSDEIAFTPSGSGTHARITKPTTPDGATFWRIWASSDNVSYYLLAGLAVGTTTYDDDDAPSTYASVGLAGYTPPEAGAYTPAWSAKYLLVDENRLLIAGAHETTRYASRVGWSAIIGTASAAYGDPATTCDDERFPVGDFPNYLDLDSDEGGELTGMESLSGSVYVFKRHAIYKLVRTGTAEAPYRPLTITKSIGAISRRAIVPGEDEGGNPCLYFLSERGPYRIGQGGLQYLGRDIETIWSTVAKRGYNFPPHGVYHATTGRLHFWVPVGNTAPTRRLTFHVKLGQASREGVRGGWTVSAAQSAYAASSALLPESLTNRDSELWPYTIQTYQAFYPAAVWKCDTTQATDDELNASTGAVTGVRDITPVATTKMFSLGLGDNSGVRAVYVACTPSVGGIALTTTLSRNFGASTVSKAKAFTGTTSRQPQRIHDLVLANAQYVSASFTSATQTAFVIDELAMRVAQEEPE